MSEVSVTVGVLSIPESRIKKIICWLPKKLVDTRGLENRVANVESSVSNIEKHIGAMSDILNILVADISDKWDTNKRERVQRMMWNFGSVNTGLASVVARGNPFTQQELDVLRSYTQQAQRGEIFTPQQATEFRNLSERAVREYPNQDWVGELLKIALFIFALYAISQILKSGK